MKKLITILLIIVQSTNAYKDEPVISFKQYLHSINKDIRTKSYMGWARLINNNYKRSKYHIDLSTNEIKIYTNELKKLNALQKKENTL